jgi:hypothetical protein
MQISAVTGHGLRELVGKTLEELARLDGKIDE